MLQGGVFACYYSINVVLCWVAGTALSGIYYRNPCYLQNTGNMELYAKHRTCVALGKSQNICWGRRISEFRAYKS